MRSITRHILLIVLFFFIIFPLYPQGKIEILKGKKKHKVSFELINNLIIIPVSLNGKKLSFILDSGAKNTVLFGAKSSDSLVLFNKIKTKVRGLGDSEHIDAIVSNYNRIKIKDLYGYNQKVYVLLDDSFDLSLKMGKPIHGIIGYEVFKSFAISIDYSSKKLTFYKTEFFNRPNPRKYEEFNLSFHHDKPYIEAKTQINDSIDVSAKLLIDTGCSDALWLFEDDKKGILPSDRYFLDHLGQGISGNIDGKRSKINGFSIGEYSFNDITTAFLDTTYTKIARTYKERSGSIGSQLLMRFNVILDYPNKKLYLKKERSFKDDFKYNRAGMEVSYHPDAKVLVRDKKNPNIVISERKEGDYKNLFEISYNYVFKRVFIVNYVRQDSPAGKAGIRLNDIIMKINDKSAYDLKLEEINSYLYGEDGKKIQLTVERNGISFYYEFILRKPL